MFVRKDRAVWIIGGLALTVTLTMLMSVQPLSACRSDMLVTNNERWFQATRIVVQPWRGPHHVYGVFSIPAEYRRHRLYRVRLVIEGLAEELPETSPESGPVDGSRVEDGHYLMRVNLPTRMALRIILTGRFGDLKAPCHWWLAVSDRT